MRVVQAKSIILRNKALSSPLFDTGNFTKDFTETLKKVYLKHMSLDKV